MSANDIAVIVFGCAFGGAMLGMSIAGRLPVHHLSSDSRDVVKMVLGTVATLAAFTTVIAAPFVCALSVSGAIFLILESHEVSRRAPHIMLCSDS